MAELKLVCGHHYLGLVPDLSNHDYHAGPGLSCSMVKTLLQSTPFHLLASMQGGASDETAAMLNGTLTHCAFLEPNEFDARYLVGPQLNKNTLAWREVAAKAATKGLQLISGEQYDAAHAQAASLRALPELADLMRVGRAEVSAYWREQVDGAEVLCRCRPDWVAEVGHGNAAGVVLVDVKTTVDASPEGFAKACASYGYHLQAAWYCGGYAKAANVQVHGMVFAVVESKPPHAAALYMLADAALIHARSKLSGALSTYAACTASNTWPGYPSGIAVIDLPQWAYK